MDPTRNRKSLSGLFSRSERDRSLFSRSDKPLTETSGVPAPQKERGKLGLTTVYEPTAPSKTVADIVFIHGLGGNSHKTWSYSANPDHFWPKAWLSSDPDFVNTRIHVFGYNANWRDRTQNPMGIFEFAQSLVGELKNNPAIRRDTSRIIIVAHSMGGCVAKKAYILARLDPTCKDLVDRMHSMFFLGTPHQGADLAPILENIMTMVWGEKPFLRDLMSNSDMVKETNVAFRHYALELRLWSFYETQPVKSKLLETIIVKKASSILGYPTEEIAPMNADHRHLCKFKNREDPSYKSLRNALHSAMDLIRNSQEMDDSMLPINDRISKSTAIKPSPGDYTRLMECLDVDDTADDDLAVLQLLKEPGSCEWLTHGTNFRSWENNNGPDILWLSGRPGAGKSVLASHVVERTMVSNTQCSYFFFKHGKRGKSTLSDCLLSIAYQMARNDNLIRTEVLQLMEDQSAWDRADEAIVWRRLFLGTIFKSPSLSQHCWVMDGIDECSNFNSFFTKRILVTIPPGLRIFATSRDLDEVVRGLSNLGPRVVKQTMSEEDTFDDMRLFLSTKLKELDRLETDVSRQAMCDKILTKSRGSFLWVRLVLRDFENAWTNEAMEAVLEDVPSDLHDVYLRILRAIETDPRKAKLAKPLLMWVVNAARPFSIDELQCAIKLEINETMQSLAKAIPSLCGQLVCVDQGGNVQVIHETARQFLLRSELNLELVINEDEAHNRIAKLLLAYLSSGVLKIQQKRAVHDPQPRGFRSSKTAAREVTDLALVMYASRYFSEHACRSFLEDGELTNGLYAFVRSYDILYWIEHHANRKDLGQITQTAMNIRGYLEHMEKHVPSTDPKLQLIDRWAMDLLRVAAKFRSQLLNCPSSIHCLIPPLCPTDSIIWETFSKAARLSPLIVRNIPQGSWEDCLTRIDFEKGELTAITHGMRFFAVGGSTGFVSLYDSFSVQCLRELPHQERLRILQFSPDDAFLVSCGTKQLYVWNTLDGSILLSATLQAPPIAVTFPGSQELLVAFQNSVLMKWDFETGEVEELSWKAKDQYDDTPGIPDQPPSRATFSSVTMDYDSLMAVGYRSHPINIWSPLELLHLGECGTSHANGVLDMVFSPNLEITALVVSLAQGDLYVYNYTTLSLDSSVPKVFAYSLCCSQNGRTLVTGSSQGILQVFKFNLGSDGNIALAPIYRARASNSGLRGASFSFDGLRLVTIDRRQCQVWEPAALIRKDSETDTISGAIPQRDDTPRTPLTRAKSQITTPLVSFKDGNVIFAGKNDGGVWIFDREGRELSTTHSHSQGTSVVRLIASNSGRLIISADNSGRVLVVEFLHTSVDKLPVKSSFEESSLTKIILDRRFGAPIVRLTVNAEATRLLVSGHFTDELWELPSGTVLCTLSSLGQPNNSEVNQSATSVQPIATRRSAFEHPIDPSLLVTMTEKVARIFRWEDFSEVTGPEGITLQRAWSFSVSNSRSASYFSCSDFVIEHFPPSLQEPGRLILWPAAAFDANSEHAGIPILGTHLDDIGPTALMVLGLVKDSRMVFIDSNLWICSTELSGSGLGTLSDNASRSIRPVRGSGPLSRSESITGRQPGGSSKPLPVNTHNGAGHIRRHFFALSEWRDAANKICCTILPRVVSGTSRHRGLDFAFAFGQRIVVVEGGTEFSETIVSTTGSTTSISTVAKASSRDGERSPSISNAWTVVSGSMHRRASVW